jgi:DNA-binding MarR family transcriptional regulator
MARLEDELQMVFKTDAQKALLNILFTANCIRHMDNARLAPYDLSPQQYNILRILRGAKGEPMCMHQVRDRMLDRAPNATRLTDKLIAKKLIVRDRSEDDRRMVFLRISPAGLALLEKVDKESTKGLFVLHDLLTAAESRTLNAALDRLRDHL